MLCISLDKARVDIHESQWFHLNTGHLDNSPRDGRWDGIRTVNNGYHLLVVKPGTVNLLDFEKSNDYHDATDYDKNIILDMKKAFDSLVMRAKSLSLNLLSAYLRTVNNSEMWFAYLIRLFSKDMNTLKHTSWNPAIMPNSVRVFTWQFSYVQHQSASQNHTLYQCPIANTVYGLLVVFIVITFLTFPVCLLL